MKRHGGTLNAYYQVKEANLKRLHTLSFQLYMTFWERQNCRDGEEISGSEDWRESLTTKGQHEGSFWKLFCT